MLHLERSIAFLILVLFLIYGYTAWFVMDALLPPVLKFNPIWPSSFPKIISVLGVVIALGILLTAKGDVSEDNELDIKQWRSYDIKPVLLLLAFMTVYALTLRPLGFLIATPLFLFASSLVLGEKRYLKLAMISFIAAFIIWNLVDTVLGIYLHPLPLFMVPAGG